MFSDDETLTPDPDADDPLALEAPLSLTPGIRIGTLAKTAGAVQTRNIRKMGRKDLKKGGEGARGKNVLEGARVKSKDLKQALK